MRSSRKILPLIILIVLGLFLSGCQPTGQPNDPGHNDPGSVEPQMMDVAVYYAKATDTEYYLVREVHQVAQTDQVARAALNELIQVDPVTDGAARLLPADTKILGINIEQGLATVDFSADVLQANVGSSGEALGIASIVNTLTEFPTIKRVSFTVEGQVDDQVMNWWGHVGLYEQPFQRDLSTVYEPVIWVTAPVKYQVISSPVTISGTARVFEATVSYRLVDEAGNVLAQGFTTASEGAPGRGDFTGELAFESSAPGKGQLEVFEVSMKDGSDLHKVVIPVQWQ